MELMTTTLLIGTKKGLWIATSDDRRSWAVRGPEFSMQSVSAAAVDTRGATPRLLVGAMSQHWGPTVSWSDDGGTTWQETPGGGIRFPEAPAPRSRLCGSWHPTRPIAQAWSGPAPSRSALWRSDDGGETFALVEGLWDHPHRPTWEPGFGGQAVHTVLPDPVDDDRVLVAMSTGGVYAPRTGGRAGAVEQRHPRWFFPDTLPSTASASTRSRATPADPNGLYAQNHGGVYVSHDAGASWVASRTACPPTSASPSSRTRTARDGVRRPAGG